MVVPIQRQTSVMVEVSGLSESQTSPILTGKVKIKSLSVIQEKKKSNLMTYISNIKQHCTNDIFNNPISRAKTNKFLSRNYVRHHL